MRLRGQAALVTGAGRGIGRAVARALGREGAAVALVARSAPELEGVAKEVREAGGDALVAPADVTDAAAVEDAVRRARERFGRVDVLVTAAGTAGFAPAVEMALAEWDRIWAVNVRGAVACCRAVLPAMVAQGRGTIVNVGSVVTTRALAGTAAYTASKYALLGFSRVLAEEVRPHGVRVGVLTAGATDTPLWDAVPGAPERARMLTPEQVAEAAVLMATLAPNAVLEEVRLLPAGGIL